MSDLKKILSPSILSADFKKLGEEKKTVEVSEAITETPSEETTAEVQPEAAPKPATKEDVLNRLKELAQDAENANKQEIDNLKQSA